MGYPKQTRAERDLVLRSSNSVDEGAPSVARWQRGTAPDPWSGAGIQLGRGDPRGEGDLAGVGEALAGQGLAAEQPPPALLQVQPARLLGDEHLLEPRMASQPLARGHTGVAGQV